MKPQAEAASFTERLARVLECFEPPPHECSFMQIVRRTGLPRASTHRMISQLSDIGYLEPGTGARGYRLGARLYGLLHAHLDPDRLTALARPVLAEVAQACGVASFGARLAQGRVDLFATATPDDPMRSHVFPGTGMRPVHACSSAKALVAFQPETLRAAMLTAPRESFTRRTLTGDDDLIAEYAPRQAGRLCGLRRGNQRRGGVAGGAGDAAAPWAGLCAGRDRLGRPAAAYPSPCGGEMPETGRCPLCHSARPCAASGARFRTGEPT